MTAHESTPLARRTVLRGLAGATVTGALGTGTAGARASRYHVVQGDRCLPVEPLVGDYLDRFGVDVQQVMDGLSSAAVAASRFIASQALVIGQNALRITALFFLMLYLLFFFLRDGGEMVEAIIRVLPLGDERERRLFDKFSEVARATIKGTLVVGFVQGFLGGLLFWILGIAAPVFWGVIMTVLSLLPAIGSALVWLPAAIILMATGSVLKGIILIAVGTLVIGLVDNLLRPLLVGRDTKMPDFLILLSTLGGITVFGISGFVIGPIIAAFFLVVWDMFRQEYAAQDASIIASPNIASSHVAEREQSDQPA